VTVALESTFRELQFHFHALRDSLEALTTTAEEDRPTRDDVVVTARLTDALLAARGLLEEACEAARDAAAGVAYPFSAERARRALTTCQERFHRFAHHFSLEIASYERIDDVRSVGQERGGDWLKWADVVKQAVEQCSAQAEEVRNAVFLCWQELAERIGASAVSVENTTIGQQITMRNRCGDRTASADVTPG
jgi:hypothetical protein